MFLSAENLYELTERRRPSDQIAWLRDRGWRFEVSAAGRPRVLVEEMQRKMLGGTPSKTKGCRPRLELVK